MRRSRLSPRKEAGLAAALLLSAELVGLGMIAWGARELHQARDFVERSWPTEGMVIAFAREPKVAADPLQPVIGFSTPNGGSHELRPRLLLPWNGYTIGDRVTVLYDPARPAEARLDRFEQLWLTPAFTAALGGLLVGGPAAAWLLGLFRPRRTAPPSGLGR